MGDVIESLKTNITPSYNVSKFIEDQYAVFQDGDETTINKGIDPSPVNNVISAYIFLQKIFLLSNANNGGDKYYKLREVPHKAKGFPEETMSLGSVFIKPGDISDGDVYSTNSEFFQDTSQRDEFIKEHLEGGRSVPYQSDLEEKTQPGIYYYLQSPTGGQNEIPNYSVHYKIVPDLKELTIENRQDTDVFFLNYNNMITDEDTVLDEGFYFRFGHILSIINKKIITKIKSSDQPLLEIDSGQWSNRMYTFPYQVSLDPRICLVKNPKEEPVNSKEYIISAASWKNPTKFDYAWTMNIYLNGKFITDTISNNIDENGDISLFSFLSTICTELNKALGGVNNLEPVIDEDENKIYIIDGSYSKTEKSSDYQLELYGYNGNQSNFVKDVSIKTELTNDFATMATVGSTAGGYVKGVENTMFSRWNKGLIDRFKEELVPANKASREPSDEGRAEPHEAYVKEFWNRIYSPFGVTYPQDIPDDYGFDSLGDTPALNNEIIDKNIAVVTEFYKYCQSVIQSKYKKYASPTNGFIPISLNATFDGLSGIKIYNAINADTRFLPPNYPEALKFIIKGVNHKISQNGWDTTIDTVVIANNVDEKGAPILPYDNLKNEVKTIIDGGKVLATEDTFATFVQNTQQAIVNTASNPPLPNESKSTSNSKLVTLTKEATQQQFKEEGENSAYCGGWTFKMASRLASKLTGKPRNMSGGNDAWSETIRKNLNNLGIYKPESITSIATNLSPELARKKANEITTQANYGDVLVYFGTNPGPPQKVDGKAKYHAQIFTGDTYKSNGSIGWSSSNKNNYKSPFVYRSGSNFSMYWFRIKDEYKK